MQSLLFRLTSYSLFAPCGVDIRTRHERHAEAQLRATFLAFGGVERLTHVPDSRRRELGAAWAVLRRAQRVGEGRRARTIEVGLQLGWSPSG